MNFEDAIEALKQNKRVTRAAWSGNNQFVHVLLAQDPEQSGQVERLFLCAANGKKIPWKPSFEDMQADDWQEVTFLDSPSTLSTYALRTLLQQIESQWIWVQNDVQLNGP